MTDPLETLPRLSLSDSPQLAHTHTPNISSNSSLFTSSQPLLNL
jgi:hypothetical protein